MSHPHIILSRDPSRAGFRGVHSCGEPGTEGSCIDILIMRQQGICWLWHERRAATFGRSAENHEVPPYERHRMPQVNKYQMTVNGSRLLREEANYRRTVRATDESKENTERIAEIDHKLANAVVVDVTKITRNGTVFFGTTVTLENADTSDEVTYQIVGEDEADIKTGKLSASDPIAKALLGKSEGDTVVVETPSGTVTYEILTVEHI
ncbi:hypothetical protein GCM10017778_33050 [Streptomyces vinaceus]|nr:hypothetical protein GCM10017778_33050 [Streptomyces vinaceus]